MMMIQCNQIKTLACTTPIRSATFEKVQWPLSESLALSEDVRPPDSRISRGLRTLLSAAGRRRVVPRAFVQKKKKIQPAAAVTVIRHSLSIWISTGPELLHFYNAIYLSGNNSGWNGRNAGDGTFFFQYYSCTKETSTYKKKSQLIHLSQMYFHTLQKLHMNQFSVSFLLSNLWSTSRRRTEKEEDRLMARG